MKKEFMETIGMNPVIAAIKNGESYDEVFNTPVEMLFLLGGNICNIGDTVKRIQENERKVYIHVDLVEGLGRDYFGLKYIREAIKPDGILTTKTNLAKHAKEMGIFTIQRFFMLDSISLESALYTIKSVKPDAVEIMPGLVPQIIRHIKNATNVPIIAGGLIQNKSEAIACIKAGALGISTSKKSLWTM